MRTPVFAVDEVRYRPDEPRERLFIGQSAEAIERYRPEATNDEEATFSELSPVTLPWYELFLRISKISSTIDWDKSVREFFIYLKYYPDYSDAAELLYISDVGVPKLFE